MTKPLPVLFALLLTALTAPAQDSILRGEVTDLPGTPRRFAVAGAPSIRLVSTQVDLASLYDAGDFAMTVRPASGGSANTTTLEVLQARRTGERFEIDGGLRIGSRAVFTVRGRNRTIAATFLTPTARTSFLPLPGAGSWLLGAEAALIGQRPIEGGEREFFLGIPSDASLVGLRITAQAAVFDGASVFLTNVDAATIQN